MNEKGTDHVQHTLGTFTDYPGPFMSSLASVKLIVARACELSGTQANTASTLQAILQLTASPVEDLMNFLHKVREYGLEWH